MAATKKEVVTPDENTGSGIVDYTELNPEYLILDHIRESKSKNGVHKYKTCNIKYNHNGSQKGLLKIQLPEVGCKGMYMQGSKDYPDQVPVETMGIILDREEETGAHAVAIDKLLAIQKRMKELLLEELKYQHDKAQQEEKKKKPTHQIKSFTKTLDSFDEKPGFNDFIRSFTSNETGKELFSIFAKGFNRPDAQVLKVTDYFIYSKKNKTMKRTNLAAVLNRPARVIPTILIMSMACVKGYSPKVELLSYVKHEGDVSASVSSRLLGEGVRIIEDDEPPQKESVRSTDFEAPPDPPVKKSIMRNSESPPTSDNSDEEFGINTVTGIKAEEEKPAPPRSAPLSIPKAASRKKNFV